MAGRKEKEDPEDRKDRLRQRRQAEIERRAAAEQNATGLSSDLRSVFDLSSLSAFGSPGKKRRPVAKAAPKARVIDRR